MRIPHDLHENGDEVFLEKSKSLPILTTKHYVINPDKMTYVYAYLCTCMYVWPLFTL